MLPICTVNIYRRWRIFAAAKGKPAGIFFSIIFGAECGLMALGAALLSRAGLTIWIPIAGRNNH
jgi:hypothetical protein